MAAETIENVYYDFRSNYQNTAKYVIDTYNRSAILLNNITSFKNKEELKMYIELNSKYVEALYQLKHYNDLLDVVDKNQGMIDSEIMRFDAAEVKDEWYYQLFFVKGMASYGLKDYKTSTPIFKELVALYPKNELYKNWLAHSKYRKFDKYGGVVVILTGIIIIINIFFKNSFPYYLRQGMLIVSLVCLISGTVYNSYLKRSLRRK
jgi:hypothetical protein